LVVRPAVVLGVQGDGAWRQAPYGCHTSDQLFQPRRPLLQVFVVTHIESAQEATSPVRLVEVPLKLSIWRRGLLKRAGPRICQTQSSVSILVSFCATSFSHKARQSEIVTQEAKQSHAQVRVVLVLQDASHERPKYRQEEARQRAIESLLHRVVFELHDC
jgi:hypothetical protein